MKGSKPDYYIDVLELTPTQFHGKHGSRPTPRMRNEARSFLSKN